MQHRAVKTNPRI